MIARKNLLALLILLTACSAAVWVHGAPAPKAVEGVEVYRRSLPANSVVRVYVGGVLKSTTPAVGDTLITVGVSTAPPPTPQLQELTVPPTMPPGTSATGSVRLSAVSSAPSSVALSSDVSALVAVPASVTVPAGQTTASFSLSAGRLEGTASVSALLDTVKLSRPVQVRSTPPEPGPDPNPTPGGTWYVSPTGSPTGQGTKASPWDLESAVNGTRKTTLSGGGTVYLMAGVYRKSPNPEGLGFRCAVGGTASAPLVFRPDGGARVTIDGGWSFFTGTQSAWLRDVSVTVSDLVMGQPPFGEAGSWPPGAPNGGLNAYQSRGCKAINCFLTRNRQGASIWTEAEDFELYGCVIWDNGWIGSDRSHGHAIYTQNPAGRKKLIADNIITHTPYSRGWRDGRYGLHGYGERVPVTDISVEGNFGAGSNDAWLLGAGAAVGPSTGHRFLANAVYGVRVNLGSRIDQPLEVRGNIVAGEIQMSTGSEVTKSGNIFAPPEQRPSVDQILMRVNKYDPNRANLMLIDWDKTGRVRLNLSSSAIPPGQPLRIVEPTDVWGAPIFSGAWPAAGIELPVDGARVLILIKEPGPPGAGEAIHVEDRIEEAPVSPALRRRG